ncbi:MAG: helix-turn-helix domain-containing protein [Clostridia bacterium]|nr:helix-turn-helix domain-containing protein [Clostridia bacterium]
MNLSPFIEKLQDLMIENNLNAPALAKILGCSRASINKYLNGKKIPSLDMSIRMANYFQCTMETLLGIDEENHINDFFPCPLFKDRLPFLCKYFNISRYELCKRINISESVAYYWSKGTTSPSLESVIKIAECLDCSIDFVIGRTKI